MTEPQAGWMKVRLGDLADGVRGVSYQPHQLLKEGSGNAVVLLRANNIQDGRLHFEDVQIVPSAIVKPRQLLEPGDIAVCMSNGSKRLVGKSAQYAGELGADCTVGAFCSLFKVKEGGNSTFVRQLFQSSEFQAHVDVSLAGSAINNLKNSDLESIEFCVPSAVAQSKIAAILQAADQAIEKTEALIEKYQQIKAGLMHDLFTRGIDTDGNLRPPREQAPELYQETPIGWIPREWDYTSCSSFCDKIIDCKNRTPPITADGYPVIRTPNVRDGAFVDSDLVFTDRQSYKIWTARGRPQVGDIVITREAPVGEVCRIPERHPEACLGQRMMLYRPNQEKVLGEFLLYAFQSNGVQKRLDVISGGSTVGHVRVGDIRELRVPIPKAMKEQERVAGQLGAVSDRLASERGQMSKLVQIKAGLMADLLSGNVEIANV